MDRKKRAPRKGRWIVPLVLLAVVCIGAAELTASYFFAPAVFDRITGPVRQGASAVAAFFSETVSSISERLSAENTPSPQTLEIQLAEEPDVISDGPIADPAVTELRAEDGGMVLTGGSIPITYFNQGEEPWASQLYGSDPIAGYGCGPTAMAMVVSSMTDTDTDPAQMAQWAASHGYWAKGGGSYLSIVEGAAETHGLTVTPVDTRTPAAIRSALLSGDILVALMGPGHFTNRGHFILLRGATLSGSVLVADPNSVERSLTEWDPQLILDELSTSTADGAPLWAISRSAS